MEVKLERVNENKWMIPQEGDMKVPAYIFASDKLIKLIKRDKTLTQLRNLTYLPGIYKQALCMPDGHQGYGFPIGGVAALDYHEGGISPGGIGYDINCLTPDTKILTPLGCYKQISELSNNEFVANNNSFMMYKTKQEFKAITFNEQLKDSKINFVMKKDGYKKVLTIKTLLGRTINCSSDHPILTDNGMIKAGELTKGGKLITHAFTGVEHEELSDKELISEQEFKGQIRTNLEKRNLLPLKENNNKLPYLTRLIGFLFGDGTIYYNGVKGFVNLYGGLEELKMIQKDLAIIGFKSKIYSRERNHKITTQYGTKEFTSENHELHCNSKSLAKLLEKLGTPIGNKTRQDYLVPNWVMKSKRWVKRLFLSGFFSAELSKPKLMSKYNYYTPILPQNKIIECLESGHQMLEQISDLLKEFNVRINKISLRKEYKNRYDEETYRLRLIIASDSENLINLYSKIGFDYNKKRQNAGLQAINYLLYKESVMNIRQEFEKQAIILKSKGMNVKEIMKELNSSIINKRFIERSVYSGQKNKPRPPKGFITLKEFTDKTKFSEQLYKDEIVSITEQDYQGPLYDINVNDKEHNFCANNIIVSNCGVRLMRTQLTKETVKPKINELIHQLFRNVPSGVGVKGVVSLSNNELNKVLEQGSQWALNNGYATQLDVDNTEENGQMPGKASLVSQKARGRGLNQLGSLGAGNHFLEVQAVEEIYDETTAKGFGINQKGQVMVMIHCGSRGLGHQVCSDYLRLIEKTNPEISQSLPDRELVYAPAGTKIASQYLGAMSAAANFAWCNRQVIASQVRKVIKKVLNHDQVEQVYDVCHNICKIEEYDGKKQFIHRKGATRCIPKGHSLVPKAYKNYGQPVIIPGTMGTASYVLVGQESCLKETFASTAHGAGRVMSRHQAIKKYHSEQVKKSLKSQGITVMSKSFKGISEEAPGAYKDVDEVVHVSEEAGIAKRVVKLRPLGVIKG